MKQLSITQPDQDVGSVFKAGEAESKSHIGVGRESRLEHSVIHFDDGCACLYLLHSINSFLSLLHPVCEGFCTIFPPGGAGILKKKKKKWKDFNHFSSCNIAL